MKEHRQPCCIEQPEALFSYILFFFIKFFELTYVRVSLCGLVLFSSCSSLVFLMFCESITCRCFNLMHSEQLSMRRFIRMCAIVSRLDERIIDAWLITIFDLLESQSCVSPVWWLLNAFLARQEVDFCVHYPPISESNYTVWPDTGTIITLGHG